MAKFKPSHPFTLQKEDKLTNKDSRFISGIVSEHIRMGGVVVYAWLQDGNLSQINSSGVTNDPLNASTSMIQDTVILENRDRKYSDEAVRLVGAYTASMNALDYARFGLLIGDDIVQMEFHWEDMERQCGRRLIPGDVVEMPHLKSVAIDGRISVKWYEVKSIIRSPGSYDHTYNYHIVAVTLAPIKDAQEFADLMNRETENGGTLSSDSSNHQNLMDVTIANQDAAYQQAYTTWWDTRPIYIDPVTSQTYRWTDDATPPNGLPVTQVSAFPVSPAEGDYVIRVDMYPNKLYRYQSGAWVFKEVDRKREWNTYNWVVKLREFATDGSADDDARPWDFKSIHDVGTPRQNASDPSPRGDGTYLPPVGEWAPLISFTPPNTTPAVTIPLPDPTVYTTTLIGGSTLSNINDVLNATVGTYKMFYIQYTIQRDLNSQFGEILIEDDGINVDMKHEWNDLYGDVGVTFTVAYDGLGNRVIEYSMTAGSAATMTYRIKDKWTA